MAGLKLWDAFMDELRFLHLGAPSKARQSVDDRFKAAHLAALGRQQ